MKTKLLRKIRKECRIMIDNKGQYYYVKMMPSLFSQRIAYVDNYKTLNDAIQRQHVSMRVEIDEIRAKKLMQISPKNKSK
ncbi:MAG: hypothetical protein PHQ11_15645 [Paludibacter sp.]|nr:hypothetical protein [Paludibacter sp.]